jgi:transposase InsO family protein
VKARLPGRYMAPCLHRRSPLPRADRGGRTIRGVLGSGRRYIAVRWTGGLRARRHHRQARSTAHGGQRQWHRVHQHRDPALVQDRQIDWHYIAPGQPMQNGFIESFNGTFRDECFNETLFSSFPEARDRISAWKEKYNSHRLHSSLGNLTANYSSCNWHWKSRPHRAKHQRKVSPWNRRDLGAQGHGARLMRRRAYSLCASTRGPTILTKIVTPYVTPFVANFYEMLHRF